MTESDMRALKVGDPLQELDVHLYGKTGTPNDVKESTVSAISEHGITIQYEDDTKSYVWAESAFIRKPY